MQSKPFRIYADTSVLGGCEDPEFDTDSRRFIEGVGKGRYILLLTDIVIAELEDAPEKVRRILPSLSTSAIERIDMTEEIIALRNTYIDAGIVADKWADDATHVAAATVARADAIISWNFQHIVRLDKMKRYNEVNLRNGYGILTIISPRELINDEEEQESV